MNKNRNWAELKSIVNFRQQYDATSIDSVGALLHGYPIVQTHGIFPKPATYRTDK